MFLLVQVLILLWSCNSANVFILQVMKWQLTWFFWVCLFFFNLSYQPDYCYFVCQNSLRGSREIQIVDLASLWEWYTDRHIYIETYMQTPTLSFHGTNIVAMRALAWGFGFLSLQPYSSTHMSHLGLFS